MTQIVQKYNLIVDQIERDIRASVFKPGQRLPSIRKMSETFSCSKSTVLRAYDEMENRHMIYAVPNSGYYLLGSSTGSKINPGLIDFSAAVPDVELLPYKDFQHCLNQAIDIYKESLFSYGDPQGLPSLRKALVSHLSGHQVFTHEKNIYVTSGSQQALSILSALAFPNGKRNILLEQPCYSGAITAAAMNNVTLLGIQRTFDGIDLSQLENAFKNQDIKYFYTVPRFQNPTGGSLSNPQKKAILELAEKYDVYIVEDDFLADLEIDSKSDPICAFDTQSRVIYIKSFSKVLLPGLRLGLLVLPDMLADTFRNFKRAMDINTNILSQGALEVYIKSGMFDAHIARIRDCYHARMQHMKASASAILGEYASSDIPETGFFHLMKLPEEIDILRLKPRLYERQVAVSDAAPLYLPGYKTNDALRLGICRTSPSDIDRGLNIIKEELPVCKKSSKSSFYTYLSLPL